MLGAGISGGKFLVLLGDGQGNLTTPLQYDVAGPNNPSALAVGDLNGDGRADVASTTGLGAISILMNDGTGAFPAHVEYATAYSGADLRGVAMVDLDGDGNLDVITIDASNSALEVFMGRGDGGVVTPPATYGTAQGPLDLAVGDFNHDGVPDVATACQYGVSGGVSVLLGFGDGGFDSALPTLGGESASIAAGDVDGDGNLDLVATVLGSTPSVAVFLGNGNGTFQSGVTHAAGLSPNRIILQDLDGDGRADLVMGNGLDAKVSVLLAAPDGGFAPEHDYSGTSGQHDPRVAVGTLNGDAFPDIVSTDGSSVSVFLAQ
ncbi:MAG: VCBS repeat-containing protein [Deltaproteobacteria bacterium]|nr:VCBS repeat-containing protein [Deltaproteobacteria bacterium]